MKIVIFEDDDGKYEKIKSVVISKGIGTNNIIRIETLTEFARIISTNFDLCIIDLKMPSLMGGVASNVGKEILQMLDYSGKKRIPVLAITSFLDEAENLRDDFSARGCLIYDFNQPNLWAQALDIYISQAQDRNRYDFIIFTALKEERDPFGKIHNLKIESVSRDGIDCWDCEFKDQTGTIVLLPRMGLVNATSIVSRVLATYSPKIVSMCGICGGIGKNAELGQLLVTDVCWEYQSGKWISEAHEAEPYHTNTPQKTRAILLKLLESDTLLTELESTYSGRIRPSIKTDPSLAIFTSGSAVIASETRLKNVQQQHRKVGGIDMEIYGFHRAVELSGQNIHAFSSKVVVDKANETKSDSLHEYGSYISAQFTLEAIQAILEDLKTNPM